MKPYSLARDEGDAIWMFDALDTIKAGADETAGAMSVVEFLDFEGSSVPFHLNEHWDNGFYVVDGDYTFVHGCRLGSSRTPKRSRVRRRSMASQ